MYQRDPQMKQTALRGGGPTVTRVWFALALLCFAIVFAAAVLA